VYLNEISATYSEVFYARRYTALLVKAMLFVRSSLCLSCHRWFTPIRL